MKKNIFFLLLCLSLLNLTTCGSSKSAEILQEDSVSQELTADDDLEDPDFSTGEGEVTGGIPSDEEIAERESEAEAYDADSADNFDENTNENIDMSEDLNDSTTYASADNFWQGDDYFDLEGYLRENGATSIKKGHIDFNIGDFVESDDNITIYVADFEHPYWVATIYLPAEMSGVSFRYGGYVVNGQPRFTPEHLATPSVSYDKQRVIKVDSIGTESSDVVIAMLDKMIYLTRQYPNEDDPFQYNDDISLFSYTTSRGDIPSDATKR